MPMRFACQLFLIFALFLSGCNTVANDVSAEGIPSPTPFQPQEAGASDPIFSAPAPTPLDLPTTTSVPTEIAAPPQEADTASPAAPGELDPLTGLPPADPSLLNRRPIAIKVANYPRYMRPQSGLTLADQVFEYFIEKELTRFIAVFYGNDSEWVGPVRSGRYFDEHILRMYQSYLVFKFADPRELEYFRASDFSQFLVTPTNSAVCPPFHFLPERMNTVEEYNNSYFDTTRWKDCVSASGGDNLRPSIRSGYFSDVAPAGDLPATKINTYYSVDSYNYWEYNPNDRLYYRFQEINDMRDGVEEFAPLVDRVTGLQVHASNVIVLFVNHSFANNYDSEDEVFQIDLTGTGEAYVFRDGVGILAKWYRTDINQPLLLTSLSGSPILMRPGITFYEVIGLRSYVDQGDGEWTFRHDWP